MERGAERKEIEPTNYSKVWIRNNYATMQKLCNILCKDYRAA